MRAVAGEEVLLAELLDQVAVVLQQGPGDALRAGAGLAGGAAAVDADLTSTVSRTSQ